MVHSAGKIEKNKDNNICARVFDNTVVLCASLFVAYFHGQFDALLTMNFNGSSYTTFLSRFRWKLTRYTFPVNRIVVWANDANQSANSVLLSKK